MTFPGKAGGGGRQRGGALGAVLGICTHIRTEDGLRYLVLSAVDFALIQVGSLALIVFDAVTVEFVPTEGLEIVGIKW